MPKDRRSNRVRPIEKALGQESCLLQGCLIKIIDKMCVSAINKILVVKLQVSIAIFVSSREQIFQNQWSELQRME